MLYVLFSPSESKRAVSSNYNLNDLLFSLEKRKTIIDNYNLIVNSSDIENIKTLVGLKKESDLLQYSNDIYSSDAIEAVKLYSGVAYDYLDFFSLHKKAQDFLYNNLIIFSNLFGPILGKDRIPNYKVKQGNTINGIFPEKYYKEIYQETLDDFLKGHDILDLRAGYYDKFYKTSQQYTTLKFLKNGKSVSHWAKAYRGVVLKAVAQNQCSSIEDFHKLNIENLSLEDIKINKNKTEIVFNLS